MEAFLIVLWVFFIAVVSSASGDVPREGYRGSGDSRRVTRPRMKIPGRD